MKTRYWIGLIGGLTLCMLGMSASATVLQPEHCDDCSEQTYSFGFSWWNRVFSLPRSGDHGGGSNARSGDHGRSFNIRTLFENLFKKPASHTRIAYNPVGHDDMSGGGRCEQYTGGNSSGRGDSGGDGDCTDKEVPEPGILGLLGIGLVGMVLARRRRKTT